jgi:hypothetical protein
MTELSLPRRHELKPLLDISKEGRKALHAAYEFQPGSYEELVALNGMGPKKIRALALISDKIYGAKPSWKDPAKYSFAYGGKDGTPYPVDRVTVDSSIQTLKDAIDGARVDKKEKYEVVKEAGQVLRRICIDLRSAQERLRKSEIALGMRRLSKETYLHKVYFPQAEPNSPIIYEECYAFIHGSGAPGCAGAVANGFTTSEGQ